MLLPALLAPPLQEAVVYEANLRAEGPMGGFASLTRRLDSIQALGVNVLWLMPVQPVGKVRSAGCLGSPYATQDYDAVNPEFGSPAELKTLIAEAHRRRMRVILDWVANHTAWDNPWITAHPDWYTHDAKGAITIPAGTNWNDVADLNYEVKPMREAMIVSMQGWVRRFDIDGFRCDTADWVPADFWKEAIARLRATSPHPLFMLAEGFRKENVASGFDLQYGWPFYDAMTAIFKGAKATTLANAAKKEAVQGPALRFVTNHDKAAWEGTPLNFFKTPEGVRTATVVTSLYGGGIPLVYSGQEVAFAKRIPIFDRSTIDWSEPPLSPPGGSAERGDAKKSAMSAGVVSQVERGQGVRGGSSRRGERGERVSDTRKWLASLYALRRTQPALRKGDLTDLSTDDAVVFRRQSGNDEALVVANVRDHSITVPLPSGLDGAWRRAFTDEPTAIAHTIALPAYTCEVYVRKNGG